MWDAKECFPVEEYNLDYPALLNNILGGIADVIKVYKPDGTIVFYNEEACKYYNTTPQKVVGKKCYEILGKTCRCDVCVSGMVLKSRKLVRIEKYVAETDRYEDYTCNPVFDNDGNIVLLVEQIRDISEKRRLELAIRESQERYKLIFESSPDGILLSTDEKVVLVNNTAAKFLQRPIEEIVNKEIHEFIVPEHRHIQKSRYKKLISEKAVLLNCDFKLIMSSGGTIDVDISSSFIIHEGKPSILSIIHNISNAKRELRNASEIQRQTLIKEFPIPSKAHMETMYMPAKTVSGDNYCIYEVEENFVTGIIYDVSGKGIKAALSVSAFNVLFNEAILKYKNPIEILNYLNQKASAYLGEKYVAACCFSFDFINNEAVIVGAGINRFAYSKKSQSLEEKIVKGAFVGMFSESEFDEIRINFEKGDRFCFFTDGLDERLDKEDALMMLPKEGPLNNLIQYINDSLLEESSQLDTVIDDFTLLAIEII